MYVFVKSQRTLSNRKWNEWPVTSIQPLQAPIQEILASKSVEPSAASLRVTHLINISGEFLVDLGPRRFYDLVNSRHRSWNMVFKYRR